MAVLPKKVRTTALACKQRGVETAGVRGSDVHNYVNQFKINKTCFTSKLHRECKQQSVMEVFVLL